MGCSPAASREEGLVKNQFSLIRSVSVIIKCQECGTKFDIDETLIKGTGSKVKCSICKHIFEAYPPREFLPKEAPVSADEQKESTEQPVGEDFPAEALEDSPEPEQADQDIDFDKLFEDSLNDLEGVATETPEGAEEPAEKVSEKNAISTDVDTGPDERYTEETEPDKDYPEEEMVTAPDPYQDKPKKSRFLSIFLLIVLLLLGGAAAIVFWAPELIPDSLTLLKPTEKGNVTKSNSRLLSFKNVTGSFVNSKKGGHLFVIRGLVTNKHSKSQNFVLIKGTILDDKGKVVKQKLAYCGNTFSVEELKAIPMEEINKAMENRFGKDKTNLNVAPGASIPFMIVFGNLPDNLSEFTVESVSSSPAK